MIEIIIALVAAQIGPGPEILGRYEGGCLYPENVLERAQETMLATCNLAYVEPDSIAFRTGGSSRSLRFSGVWEGDRLTVNSVTHSFGRVLEARGLCQIYYANEEVSTIACTAVAGGRSFAANFLRSKIN